MKTPFRVLFLLSAVALLAMSGCHKKPVESDICVDFVAKLAKCQGVDLSDPRVKASIEQCHADRKAEGEEDAARLAQDDARARQFIEAPCAE